MQTFTLDIKRNKYLYLYYLFLHLVCLSWTNTGLVAPPSVLRLAVTFAVFVPLVKYFWMAPAVIILFVGLRFNSVAPFGYIPQSWNIYCWLTLIIALFHSILYKKKSLFKFSNPQILLFFFLFFVDLFNYQLFSPLLTFSLTLFVLYNSINDRLALNLAMFSFVLLTITLSIYYFIFAQEFMMSYYGSDVERATWVDPNYFGVVLGCGIVFSGGYLFSAIPAKISNFYRIVFVTCIILGFLVITLQASRGAMLAIAGALVIQLLFSKVKWYIKFISILLSAIGIVYLFQSDYFTLLIDRTLNDDGGGSGRAEIWASKLEHWSESFWNLFGTGYAGVVTKFRPVNTDCHNEFISTVISYGIIGIAVMLGAFLKVMIIRRNRAFLWSGLAFLCIAFMTLSPFTCQTGWTACPLFIVLFYKYISLDKTREFY